MKVNIKETFPFNPGRFPFFYGWVIILVGALGVLMSAPGQTIGVATFTDSLLEALSINRDQLSLAYLCGTVLSSLFMTRAGKIYDRYGARPVALAASLMLAFGLLYLSVIDQIGNLLIDLFNLSRIWILFPMVLVGFLIIRFSGQGVLSLASRTMMMKWFDKRRGFAMGFASIFASFFFSFAPALFEMLIQNYGWRGAWRLLAGILIFVFPVLVILFFREDPILSGLKPDGNYKEKKTKSKSRDFTVIKNYTLKETRQNFAFWIFALFLALQGLQTTGLTFHIVSIFEEAGRTRAEAISIFQYIAVVAVIATLFFSWLSDLIYLKYLLYTKGFFAIVLVVGAVYLEEGLAAYIAVVIGQALSITLYNVIGSVAWVRYFGKKELGAIVGQVMTLTVFGSAFGPYLFSLSLSWFDTYDIAFICSGACFALLTIGAIWANNPQLKLKRENV